MENYRNIVVEMILILPIGPQTNGDGDKSATVNDVFHTFQVGLHLMYCCHCHD